MKNALEALHEAERTGDTELKNAAESVLSALVVVLRRKEAKIPEALAKHIAILVRRRG
jgi:hypothetical protein